MYLADKFSLLESLLWLAVGAFVFYACGTHFAPRYHRLVRVTGGLCLLMAAASFAEFATASIAAPLWLLVWKTANVGALLVCVVLLFWRHKRGPGEG